MLTDIVSDLHSCYFELCELLEKLGYNISYHSGKWIHPEGRILAFTADFVDRGQYPVETLKLVMRLIEDRVAYSVCGNHDDKLRRYLRDDLANQPIRIQINSELSRTLFLLNREERVNPGFKQKVYEFLCSLPYKLILDDVIVVHAALIPSKNAKVEREIALIGEVDGSKDEKGYVIRKDNWKHNYNGPSKIVVVGHQVVEEVELFTNKYGKIIASIDTGCYKGKKLSALRLPEMIVVDVPARKDYRD